MKIDSLPPQYVPFHTVKIGTNTFENVTALLSINGFIPLLFGNGPTPRIWLSVPANKDGTEWYPLIKDNFSSHPEVVVEAVKNRVIIKTPQGTILNAVRNSEDKLNFWKLDLRAFGLALYTEEGALIVQGNRLSKNLFANVGTVLAIG